MSWNIQLRKSGELVTVATVAGIAQLPDGTISLSGHVNEGAGSAGDMISIVDTRGLSTSTSVPIPAQPVTA